MKAIAVAATQNPFIVPRSHPEHPEPRAIAARRMQTRRQRQPQHVARLRRVDHAVVPQAGGGVVWTDISQMAPKRRPIEGKVAVWDGT